MPSSDDMKPKAAYTTSSPMSIGSKPTFLTQMAPNGTTLRFLIMDAPHQSNLQQYVKECRKHQVTDVVRVCEPTYQASGFEAAGISFHEMPYPDGHSPPKDVLDRWLSLVDQTFFNPRSIKKSDSSSVSAGTHETSGAFVDGSTVASGVTDPSIAVHCVAGLGRAPVLVAIALIEFANLDPVEAVMFIRKHRRGAINEKQLSWLEQYRRSYKRAGQASCCIQ